MSKIIRLQRIKFGSLELIRVTYINWIFGTITTRDIYDNGSSVYNWCFCDTNEFAKPDELFNFFIKSGVKDYVVNDEIES